MAGKVVDRRRGRSKGRRRAWWLAWLPPPRLLKLLLWLGPRLVPWVRVAIELVRLFRG